MEREKRRVGRPAAAARPVSAADGSGRSPRP
jgi:hypothetical protein